MLQQRFVDEVVLYISYVEIILVGFTRSKTSQVVCDLVIVCSNSTQNAVLAPAAGLSYETLWVIHEQLTVSHTPRQEETCCKERSMD